MKVKLPRPTTLLLATAWISLLIIGSGGSSIHPIVRLVLFAGIWIGLSWLRRFSPWIMPISTSTFLFFAFRGNDWVVISLWLVSCALTWLALHNTVNPWLLASAGFSATLALVNFFNHSIQPFGAFFVVTLAVFVAVLCWLIGRSWQSFVDVLEHSLDDIDVPSWLPDTVRDRLSQLNNRIHNQQLQHSLVVSQIRAAAAQEERHRLARDLHDSVKQQMWSINASVAAAQVRWEHDPVGAKIALDDVRQSVQAAQSEMRAMLQHMRPAPLASVGLIQAVRDQVAALQHRSGITTTLELQTLPEDQLPPNTSDTLFRIVQEALSNIARHARATNAIIQLVHDQHNVRLAIRDNGQGFTQLPTEGMGLTNIRERVAELSGQFGIDSSSQGTHINVIIPLSPSIIKPSYSVHGDIKMAIERRWQACLCIVIGTFFVPSTLEFFRVAYKNPVNYNLWTIGLFITWIVAWLAGGLHLWRKSRWIYPTMQEKAHVRLALHNALSVFFMASWCGLLWATSCYFVATPIRLNIAQYLTPITPVIIVACGLVALAATVRFLRVMLHNPAIGAAMPRSLVIQMLVALLIIASTQVSFFVASDVREGFERLGRLFLEVNGVNLGVLLFGTWFITQRWIKQEAL